MLVQKPKNTHTHAKKEEDHPKEGGGGKITRRAKAKQVKKKDHRMLANGKKVPRPPPLTHTFSWSRPRCHHASHSWFILLEQLHTPSSFCRLGNLRQLQRLSGSYIWPASAPTRRLREVYRGIHLSKLRKGAVGSQAQQRLTFVL